MAARRLAPPPPEDRPLVVERLRRMVRRWAEVSPVLLNPDPAVVEGIVQALTRSTYMHGYPYCPCRDLTGDVDKDKVNICPCAFHRQEVERDGHCLCTLFVSASYSPDAGIAEESERNSMATDSSVRQREVTLYTTSWCYGSRRARMLMERSEIGYDTVDIEKDQAAAKQLEAWNRGYRSVPTLRIRLVMVNPTLAELERVLESSGCTPMSLDLYTNAWSPDARRVANWLEQREIECSKIDVDQDQEAASRVQSWAAGNLTVPTVDVTVRVVEPTSDALRAALGLPEAF